MRRTASKHTTPTAAAGGGGGSGGGGLGVGTSSTPTTILRTNKSGGGSYSQSQSRAGAADRDRDDQLQRALHEVELLKRERNELQDKLRRVQTQFRRLTADLHVRPESILVTDAPHARQQQQQQRRPFTTRGVHSAGGGIDLLPALRGGGGPGPGPGPGGRRGTVPLTAAPTDTTAYEYGDDGGGGSWGAAALHAQLSQAHAEIRALRAALEGAGTGSSGGEAAAAATAAAAAPSSSPAEAGEALPDGAGRAALEAELRRLQGELREMRAERDAQAAAADEMREQLYTEQKQRQEDQLAAHERLQKALADAASAAATTATMANAAAHLPGNPTTVSTTTVTNAATAGSPAPQRDAYSPPAAASPLSAQLEESALKQLESEYKRVVEALTRDKQTLAAKLEQMRAQVERALPNDATVDPMQMAELQAEARERAQQATLLEGRLQSSQLQVETLKKECGRLVAELQRSHAALTDAKQSVFQLEREKSAAETRAARAEELELALQRKSRELLHSEAEVLKLVSSLQDCHRDTEAAVRSELSARIAELQAARDEADAQRRSREKALIDCQSQLSDAKRRLQAAQEDVLAYRGRLAQAEKSRTELAAQLEVAGHTASDLTDAELHKAFAVAAMRKRGGNSSSGKTGAGGGGGLSEEAASAVELYETLGWDDEWEAGKLREAFAAAVLDLELAETRAAQLAAQVEEQRRAVAAVTAERDTLMEENAEMRRRLSHVQTVFAKQQLEAYRAAAALDREGGAHHGGGSLRFTLRGLRFTAAAEAALGLRGGRDAPVSLFLSLDGLRDYEVMLTPTLHSLSDTLEAELCYDGLDRDAATVAAVHGTTFTLQLHQHYGGGEIEREGEEEDGVQRLPGASRVVAVAELPGATVLAAREAALQETLSLRGGDGAGEVIATVAVEVCCRGLLLPVLLGQPLQDADLALSAAQVRAALVTLRAVRYLRIQVFSAEGLPLRASAGTGHITSSNPDSNSNGNNKIADKEHDKEGGTDGDDHGEEEGQRRSTLNPAVAATSTSNTPNTSAESLAPVPYVFYTVHSPMGWVHSIADTVVRPASSAPTTAPAFPPTPVDHRVVPDRELVRLLAHGSVVFVLFDDRAADARANLGLVEVPLRPLLESPHAYIRRREPIHPQGTLEVGISWVVGP